MAWVSEFLYKESKSKKKGKNIFFVFCVGGRGGGERGSDFFLQRLEIYSVCQFVCCYFVVVVVVVFFFWGGGGGIEGVVWRGGSVARVSKLFLQIIQVSKKNMYHHPSPCSY